MPKFPPFAIELDQRTSWVTSQIFPTAARGCSNFNNLRKAAADWADIALTLADRYGPPSEADFEEQFSTLRRDILELEQAAVARRS
jgi:hypothetical protein